MIIVVSTTLKRSKLKQFSKDNLKITIFRGLIKHHKNKFYYKMASTMLASLKTEPSKMLMPPNLSTRYSADAIFKWKEE